MARDYEDIHDIDDLSDDELGALVRDHLFRHHAIDGDEISVRATDDGVVFLEGRVGTEGEMRIAERVVTDLLGIVNVRNNLIVDPLRRAESPVDPEEHVVEVETEEGLLLGDRPEQNADSAEHLVDHVEAHLFGTTDVQRAVEEGASYVPPSNSTPEGVSGADATPNAMGEDH